MTTKALGKKPPSDVCNGDGDSCTPNCVCGREWHYHQALIEAADELDNCGCCECSSGRKNSCWSGKLAKKLRISAGVDNHEVKPCKYKS